MIYTTVCVSILLDRREDAIHLVIEDDGIGLAQIPPRHTGIGGVSTLRQGTKHPPNCV